MFVVCIVDVIVSVALRQVMDAAPAEAVAMLVGVVLGMGAGLYIIERDR